MATVTLLDRTTRPVTKHSRAQNKEFYGREQEACFDCVNYVEHSELRGSCAYRLNAPDYPTYKVGKFDLACDNFNIPATKIDTNSYDAKFTNIPTQVNFESKKDSGIRYIADLRILSVPDLHRMGITNQHYPVIAATIEHNGEACVFFLPNTKMVKVPHGKPIETLDFTEKTQQTVQRQVNIKLPANRYDLINLFTKISASGKVQLDNWKRVQFDT